MRLFLDVSWLVRGWWPVLIVALMVEATPRPSPAQSTPSSPVIAIIDVAVVPMDRERILSSQTVLVQGGRISAMGSTAQVHVPPGAVRIDGHGKYLLPGLADMHMHLQYGDSTMAERALVRLLANGVTTIRDVDYQNVNHRTDTPIQLSGAFLLRLRARVAAGAVLGPRIYTSGPWGPEQYIKDQQWRTLFALPHPHLDSVAAYVAAYKAAGYDFIKIHDEDAAIAESVVVAAHRAGIPFLGHVPDDLGLDWALKVRYRSIEHLMGYLPALVRGPGSPASKANAVFSEAQDAPFLAQMRQTLDFSRIPALAAATQRAGVWNCPTLELLELTARDVRDDTLARWPELRDVSATLLATWQAHRTDGNGTATSVHGVGGTLDALHQVIRALQAAGAGLLSGTDATTTGLTGYLVPGAALHRELAALVGAGLTPYQALATSTRNVAAYFGTLAESGTVAGGKRADLVLLEGNPLRDIRQTTHIAGVMLGGRWFSRVALEDTIKSHDGGGHVSASGRAGDTTPGRRRGP